jgi:ABC-2 type transport system ATP-binding protein
MIETKGLARTFRTRKGAVEAVRGVDFTVQPGEIVGFLGPNGAGKTTTLRMLTTLLTPTAGSATVAGRDLLGDPAGVRQRIGYVAQGGGTDPTCPAGEELVLQAELYRMTGAEARRRAKELFTQFDLAGLEDRPVKTLSGGQRRRLDVALGLVHEPPLVFLDEPTTGLDPQARSNLWDHIRRLRAERNVTVFLTTHYLDEADSLCDRILVIDHGRIVAEGKPDDLKRRIAGDVVAIEVTSDPELARAALAGLPGVRDVVVSAASVRLTVERGDQALPGLLRALDAAGIGLASIQLHRPTLDDVFLTLTGRSLRDENGAAK